MPALPSFTPLFRAAHAKNRLLRGGGSVHPEGNTQSRRIALGKEEGRQTKGSSRGELAPGQAVYGSASATPCTHLLQARMGPVGVCCWVSVPQ